MMVAERFQDLGTASKFSSFGEAARYISSLGYKCNLVPSIEFGWTSGGHFSITSSIANIPRYFVNFVRQVNQEIRYMIEYRPDIVVSDTRLSPILACKSLGLPSIVVLNQIRLLLSPRLRRYLVARSFEVVNGEILGLAWTLTDKILIPDLPPPYTISENNVWRTYSVRNKLKYIGFTTPRTYVQESKLKKVRSELSLTHKPLVFVHISGPRQTRMPLVRLAMNACRNLGADIQYIVSAGNPEGDPTPKSIHNTGWFYEWCPIRDEIFSLSDIIVIRGGHAAISHAIGFGKPIVTIPIENHGEQLGNSRKLAGLGLGIAVDARPLRSEQISEAISTILKEPAYQKKASEMMELSNNLNGIDNIVNIVRSYLK